MHRPSGSRSARSAATGIELRSTKVSWMFCAKPYPATRRPFSSTSVAFWPRPRRETVVGARREAVGGFVERSARRDRQLDEDVGDGLRTAALDLLAADDLDRRDRFLVRAADVGARDGHAFERLGLRLGLLRGNWRQPGRAERGKDRQGDWRIPKLHEGSPETWFDKRSLRRFSPVPQMGGIFRHKCSGVRERRLKALGGVADCC